MKMLLGIGGSEDSFRALDRTVARAREAGDDLTVAVVENPESDRSPGEVRERVESVLSGEGVDAAVRELSGDPGAELVRVADDEGFDGVVLGGGERSPMGKIRLGHIAEFVLLNANVSVTLVR
jgi:nucleotide-binding universal stress UspA family protein